MKPHRKMITNLPEVSTKLEGAERAFNTSTENFINTVTNFHYAVKQRNQDIEQGSRKTSNLNNIVKIFINFSYYLFFSPFRIVLDEHGVYVIRRWRLQQVLCAFMHTLCVIRLATEVRMNLDHGFACNQQDDKNPVQYFQIILEVASFIYKVVTLKRLWFNQEDYLNVIKFCEGKSQFAPSLPALKILQNPLFLRSFLVVTAGLSFSSLVLGKKFVDRTSSWAPEIWTSQLVKLARYTFFLDRKFDKNHDNLIHPISSADGFRAFIMALCMIQRYITGLFCDVFILSFTITLWSASKSFSDSILQYTEKIDEEDLSQWDATRNKETKRNSLVSRSFSTWDEVYSSFRVIQQLSCVINKALGSQVTCYMAEAVMYYSVHFNLVLSSSDIFVRIDLAYFYFNTFGILFMSADICSQLESIKLWISYRENRKSIPMDEFSIVLHEMIAKDVGIRGSNIFTITYSLLAVFFSSIITYFIICIQQGTDTTHVFQNSTLALNSTAGCD